MRLPRVHITLLVVLFGLAIPQAVLGQPDQLTDEFSKLSPKERARIAKEEDTNAAADAPFQTLMAQAEELFRAKDFDGAMARYKEARVLRPYNVYPKVKIEDLRVLIAKRDAEQASQVPLPTPSEPVPNVVHQAPEITPVKAETSPPPLPVDPGPHRGSPPVKPTEPVHRPLPVVTKPADRPVVPMVQPNAKSGPQLEEGERVYKEGRSIVVETNTSEEGRIVTYKKVSHPWGEEHFFREGLTISERAYKAALGR